MPTASLVRTHEGHEIPEPGTYAIDTTHSTVEFVGRHLGFAKVRGRFTKFEGNGLAGARYSPASALLEKRPWEIPGIVEHGLFLGLAEAALVADGEKIIVLRPDSAPVPLDQCDLAFE